ncbi:gliding motility lipoprotein GldD [Leptobacterium flavescens]|uniref:Gliding motility lipoprotein GldD n=1 Tax=Leptobacterium flavescens TaxID=472055 RepID=A0A6P0UPX9_9FLAO|nr:gliding motility lipoprotein GldD [Leptobacterium flavescens]NER14530.1 gliding motility lipoprotein GldD [Leptobacterium flavescens]
MIQRLVFLFLAILFFSCKNDTLPKPKAMLRLEYPRPYYKAMENPCPFGFEVNEIARLKGNADCQMEIEYPKLKATIHITYREVKNNIDSLLRDAQKLTYEHVVKADDIAEQPFINEDFNTYGMLYEVGGNAASQSQFYITDSSRHFLTGSLYFYSKPNYDSILPAAAYVKNDIRRLMESLQWK